MRYLMDSSDKENKGAVPYYVEHGLTHPRAVSGKYRNIKTLMMVILLGFWHLAPFLRWDRGDFAPSQAILIDMAGRRAYAFFIEIWPQEVYYLTGLMLLAAISLFAMSAVAGRIWCGFLCWQTVYTDLFVMVQRLIVGDRSRMLELGRKKWSLDKFGRLFLLNIIWLVIGGLSGLSFVLYFGDAFEMIKDIFTGHASFPVYLFISIVGGACYLLGAYAREHVCVYVCPYSRFQTAMQDEHSLVISYEEWRGEPRKVFHKGESFEGRGHCIDCKACVTACPTGTDIRYGNQLSCIGCGLCIDACNSIMKRHNLPENLISYESRANIEAKQAGQKTRNRIIRPRTLIYFTVISLISLILLVSVLTRSRLVLHILHERTPLFTQTGNNNIRNGYNLKILNMERKYHSYSLKISGLDGAEIMVAGTAEKGAQVALEAKPDSVASYRVYLTVPVSELNTNHSDITFILQGDDGQEAKTESFFVGR